MCSNLFSFTKKEGNRAPLLSAFLRVLFFFPLRISVLNLYHLVVETPDAGFSSNNFLWQLSQPLVGSAASF